MDAVVIIPARWNSSRFPGKPLANILGKTLIQRVWGQCVKAFDSSHVWVATDDPRIVMHCADNDMQCVLTSDDCLTGTDRVSQACKTLKIFGGNLKTIINVQGDEPLIDPEDILKVYRTFQKITPTTVCCGTCKIRSEKEFHNPNIIKIITDPNDYLLYASRAGIPTNKNLEFKWAYKQVCIYTFSQTALSVFDNGNNRSPLEMVEDIEFLRFLYYGYKIKMVEVSESSISVDVPSDIKKVEERINNE